MPFPKNQHEKAVGNNTDGFFVYRLLMRLPSSINRNFEPRRGAIE